MRDYLLIGICLVSTASHSSAQTTLQSRVRNAIHLPHIAVQFKIEYDSPGRNSRSSSVIEPDAAVRIANLQESLRGQPSDAAIFVQIAQSYPPDAPGSAARIADAYNNATTLFRKQLVKSPKDGWVISQLGEALWNASNPDEGEKLLRRAVKEAPGDWRCWATLGEYVQTASLRKILDSDKLAVSDVADIGTASRLLGPLAKRQDLDNVAAAFASSQKEAADDYDKAVSLSPSVSGPYARRFSFRFTDYLLTQNILLIARHRDPVYTQVIPVGVMNDEWTAAELGANNARLQYDCLAFEIRNFADKLSSDKFNDLSAGINKLPVDRRDKVKRGIARLAKCADGSDHTKSASVLLALASIYFLLGDIDDASQASVRAATLDPNNQQAAQAEVATYLAQKKYAEVAAALTEQIKHKDSAYSRMCLAHVYGDLGNSDAVRDQIIAGLGLFPDDLLLNLALADGLMKSRDPEALRKAGDVISNAQALFDKLPRNEQDANQANFDVTRGIYFALTGKPDVARLALVRVLNDEPDNEEAREALGAIDTQ